MTALMTMAATARPPGLGDARVPCPLCGGLIHPVAGRCKHCKEDLSSFRAGRPQAAATLPALNGRAITAPATLHAPPATNGYAPTQTNGTNGQTTTTAPAAPIAINAREGSQPILPPRETGSWRANQKPASSLWRSWPMIVIGVAVLAIVTAVVIMVLPQDKKSSGKKIGAPPPAPERMDVDPTNPKSSQLNPPNGGDPWANDDQSTPPLPHAQPQPSMPPTPVDPDPDPDDIFGSLNGSDGAAMFAIYGKACERMKACPSVDQNMVSLACATYNSPAIPKTTSCASAQRCMDAIQAMPCPSDDTMGVVGVVTTIQQCTDALKDC